MIFIFMGNMATSEWSYIDDKAENYIHFLAGKENMMAIASTMNPTSIADSKQNMIFIF